MSIFKCKMCGGNLNVVADEKVVECEYCGTKQTVPNADDEKKVNLFNRANRLRMNSEFDKAASIYEQIIAEFPEEAEAYWCLCLCNYGIEYVDDPATANKVPTVHRASFDKLRKDENYGLALENADMAARIVYEDQAKEIDRIMGEILAVSRDEQPYDIFICYKETDNIGKRTPDSVLAQDIYDALTGKDYRVFFARITLEDKLGTMYEPYIFSALNSAKVMLAVGTDYEYFNAVWVKNEWSRFIKLMAKDKSKTLIPCYKNMDPYDMPDEFKPYQSQDCGKLGFMQDLTRGIDKLFGRDERKISGIVNTAGGADTANLLKRMFMFLEDGDWSSANEYADKVLDIDAENGEAYLGKLMVEFKAKKCEQLKDCSSPFENDDNYKKVLRFGSEELTEKIKKLYDERSANFLAEVEMVIAALKKGQFANNEKTEKELLPEYRRLSKDYTAALENFESVEAEIGRLNSENAGLEQEIGQKQKKLDSLGIFAVKEKNQIKSEIIQLTALKKKNSDTIETEKQKIFGFNSKTELADTLTELNDRIYNIEHTDNEHTIRTLSYAEALKKLENSDIKKAVLSRFPTLGYTVGDIIQFGRYEQNIGSNQKTPIDWRFLSIEDNRMLVISDKALDCRQYNTTNSDITWESCSLRQWLNNEFLNSAFTKEEQAKIMSVNVPADKNPKYSTNPGNATKDKVFLLSIAEAEKYFTTDESRMCAPTPYAKKHGAYTTNIKIKNADYTSFYWLRSSGALQYYVAYVDYDGLMRLNGGPANRSTACVRPAMWINLDA